MANLGSNLNRRIMNTLYMLKREYGGSFDLYRRQGGSTDYDTGVVTVTKSVTNIHRGIILPAKVIREAMQTISVISANKSFVYGGTYDSSTRMFIVDRRDVPNLDLQEFEPTQDDWIVYKGRKYEIKDFQEFEFDSAWVFTGKAVLGDMPEQIHILAADDLLRLDQQESVTLNGVMITPPVFVTYAGDSVWYIDDKVTYHGP